MQRGDDDLFIRAACLTNKSNGCRCCTALQEQFLQTIELPVSILTLGIIDSHYEIGVGSGSSKKNAEQTAAYQVLLERGKAKKDIGEQTCT